MINVVAKGARLLKKTMSAPNNGGIRMFRYESSVLSVRLNDIK